MASSTSPLARFASVGLRVNEKRFLDLLADRNDRVQRVLGILHDHGDVIATDAAHRACVGIQQIDGSEGHALGARVGRSRAE